MKFDIDYRVSEVKETIKSPTIQKPALLKRIKKYSDLALMGYLQKMSVPPVEDIGYPGVNDFLLRSRYPGANI